MRWAKSGNRERTGKAMSKWRERIVERTAAGRPPAWFDRLWRRRRAFGSEVQQTVDWLCYAAETSTPPAELKERILSLLPRRKNSKQRIVAAAQRRWRFFLPGIEICTLSKTEGHRSILLKIRAGFTLPAHRHGRTEQAIILAGSCLSGNVPLAQGDFFLAEAGSYHEPVRALEDCLILVIAHQ